MDYFPNQQAATFFCDEVFPLIHQRRPTARFAIIGAEPSRAIRRLRQRPGITVTGTVPDARAPSRRSAPRLAPLPTPRGAPTQLPHYWAMGVLALAGRTAAGAVDT